MKIEQHEASNSWPPTERTIRTAIPGHKPEGALCLLLYETMISDRAIGFYKHTKQREQWVGSSFKGSCTEMSTSSEKYTSGLFCIQAFSFVFGGVLYVIFSYDL